MRWLAIPLSRVPPECGKPLHVVSMPRSTPAVAVLSAVSRSPSGLPRSWSTPAAAARGPKLRDEAAGLGRYAHSWLMGGLSVATLAGSRASSLNRVSTTHRRKRVMCGFWCSD